MAVNPDGVVESLDVLKDQGISPVKRLNTEAIQPFPFNQGVEGFDTGVVVIRSLIRSLRSSVSEGLCLRKAL